ncbi:C-type lectin domain family 4 member M-like [Eublepharis macularius]|uniref:C-type lectin domain family 4 member M-like n=1 Tax=Eublepharis macularius TaxID=481883 RepID=A0AA97K0P5_EUBMA|nr:C-type lectin domain family 4 member M-like [Eublepharis macularius]
MDTGSDTEKKPSESAEDAEPEEEEEQPLEEDQEPSELPATRGNKILASTGLKDFIVFLTVLLVGCVAVMPVINYFEKASLDELLNAVSLIQTSMGHFNETYKNMSEREVLIGAFQLADDLAQRKQDNVDLTRAINKVITLVSEGWKPFGGHLYYFSTKGTHHSKATGECRNRNAQLVIITSSQEEDFIEDIARFKETGFWIGLLELNDQWQWINGVKLAGDKSYWANGNPTKTTPKEFQCAEVRGCNSKLKCWYSIPCYRGKYYICKMEPELKIF